MKNGHMDGVIKALMDCSANRLPAMTALRVARTKRAVAGAYAPVVEAQDALIRAHAPEGKDRITKDDDSWEAFAEEFEKLMEDDTEVEFEPLSVEELVVAGAEFKPDSLGLLELVGILEDKKNGKK